ncbi:DUF805 domain-containing protein [Synechococcus sp. GEYO]|uniref:DUF805 domain-containing protein n=1 Tax=Synechococcus sp. GEYO TaxID=2575511 RepID=UPI000E0F4944|nr:DUF805 domain-containing protein [Synechococcus sp. GEYO]
MGPVEAFTTAWKKSFTYGGKATRAEYWWFYLVNLIAILGVYVLTGIPAGNISVDIVSSLFIIYALASVFPNLSIGVRRLRDIGKKWTWIFISFVPFIGGIWFIILMCQPSGKYETGQASNM